MVNFGKEIAPDHQQCITYCIHLAASDVIYLTDINNVNKKNESDSEDNNEEATDTHELNEII